MLRRSSKKYSGETAADKAFQAGLEAGLDAKTAAKQAQATIGLSLISGQRMRSKGFNGGKNG